MSAEAPSEAASDVRTTDLDFLGGLTADQQARLAGAACAGCGRSDTPLRAGGHAYTVMRGSRHGHPVKVCVQCPQTSPLEAALRWAAPGGEASAISARWAAGETADIRLGSPWEVIRLSTSLGIDVIQRARTSGLRLGPVLHTPPRDAVEIIVAPGTARSWPPVPRRTAVCAATGIIRCPPPGAVADDYRRWIVEPGTGADVTDADELAEIIGRALMRQAMPWAPPPLFRADEEHRA